MYGMTQYNTVQYRIYIVPRAASISQVLYSSELCYVMSAEEKGVVFKQDLKEASEEAV